MGGVISSLQFLAYKVDRMILETASSTDILLKTHFSGDSDEWFCAVGVRHPVYLVSERIYIGGIDIKMFLGEEQNPSAKLEAGITGAFQMVGEDIPAEQENKVAKNQIPALLSPYLRAAITGMLASAGFGSVILPLFNFNALAEEQLRDIEIERIDINKGTERAASEIQ